MARVAIIGSGISGATSARLLRDAGHSVVVYEKKERVGGLIGCSIESGNLFHRVGGHVFNAKNKAVSKWFWSNFDQDAEFVHAKRNAVIYLKEKFIEYPIENHLYQLDKITLEAALGDLLNIYAGGTSISARNFDEFLHLNFGETLCRVYFTPYNSKIWNADLKQVPLSWLAGKLPMPNVKQILLSNIGRIEETEMVHSTFFYPTSGGSQFIIERLLDGIEIKNEECTRLYAKNKPEVNGESFDKVVYTGDIRRLSDILTNEEPELENLQSLKSNGTTTVLCSCDTNAYSWVYLPGKQLRCHRIIMTGNFSTSNNSPDLGDSRISCTVEFMGQVDEAVIDESLRLLPFDVKKIAVNFETNSYVIQNDDTRDVISRAKESLIRSQIWLCGRFAEWEYYNMDAAIESAMKVVQEINESVT